MNSNHLHPATRLRQLRETLELSQRQLAKEFMVSSGAIASWELGSNPIPGPVLRLIELFENSISNQNNKNEKLSADILDELKNNLHTKSGEFSFLEESLKDYILDVSSLNGFQAKVKLAIIKKVIKYLSKTKGLSIKFVQLLSYLELGLPIDVRLSLGNLQSMIKPMTAETIKQTLEIAFGKKIEDIFLTFNFSPLAVTSMGQVHLAQLKDGSKVAVKVQNPDIITILDKQFSKVNLLGQLASHFGKDASAFLENLQTALYRECDYLVEAKNQEKARELLSRFPRAVVPKVYKTLTTKNILVSEFIEGENFHAFAIRATQDSKNIVAENLVKCLSTLAFCHNLIQGDIHPENFLIKNDKVVFLDFGRIINFPPGRMKLEANFYKAILNEDKQQGKMLVEEMGMLEGSEKLDFDEFWSFLLNSQAHIIKEGKFKFNREYVTRLSREGRRFTNKHKMKMAPESFWAFTYAAGSWALMAELEAECNWRKIGLETFDETMKA